jgi:hypothetical protein
MEVSLLPHLVRQFFPAQGSPGVFAEVAKQRHLHGLHRLASDNAGNAIRVAQGMDGLWCEPKDALRTHKNPFSMFAAVVVVWRFNPYLGKGAKTWQEIII